MKYPHPKAVVILGQNFCEFVIFVILPNIQKSDKNTTKIVIFVIFYSVRIFK